MRYFLVLVIFSIFTLQLRAQGLQGETVVAKERVKPADVYEVYPQGVVVIRSNQWLVRKGEIMFTVSSKNKVRGVIEITGVRGELAEAKVLKGKVNLSHKLVRVKSEKIIKRLKMKKKKTRRQQQVVKKVKTRSSTKRGAIALIGVNLTKLSGDAELAKNSKYTQGLNVGLGYGFSFRKIGFDILLSYSQQGYEVDEENFKGGSTVEYLILSGDLIYPISLSDKLSLGLKLGYSYAEPLSDKFKADIGGTTFEAEASPDVLKHIQDFQLRLGLVLERRTDLDGTPYFIEFQYFMGNEIGGGPYGVKFSNVGISALMGVRFF